MKIKIHFIKEGDKIPFHDFLKREKERRGVSEKKLGEICDVKGMHAYMHKMGDGVPNSPTVEKFEKIIGALGYPVSDFETNELIHSNPVRSSKDYETMLTAVGDKLLRINEKRKSQGLRPQHLSSTAIRKILGRNSKEYAWYGSTLKAREQLLNDLHDRDPKYKTIRLQHQDQSKRGRPQKLQKDESELIINRLLKLAGTAESVDQLPRGIYADVQKQLASIGQRRSEASVRYHVSKIWYNRKKPAEFLLGSPTSSDSRAKEILDEKIENLRERSKESKTRHLATAIIPEDRDNRRRGIYLKYSSRGHNNLVIFLTDPKNYQKYIGAEVSLFDVDFHVDPVDEALLERFKERFARLRAEQKAFPDEAEVIDFEQSWLRCDMIFRKSHGGFVVIEVKQNAIDRPRSTFKNGTKACQQLSGYCAIILDNIIRHNLDNINTENYKPIKESVDGYIAAYEISPYFQKHLSRAGGRNPVVVPRQVVEEYIGQLEQ